MYTKEDVGALAKFFSTAELPPELVINEGERITDLRKFIDGHLKIAHDKIGSNAYASFYTRLVKVKEMISK